MVFQKKSSPSVSWWTLLCWMTLLCQKIAVSKENFLKKPDPWSRFLGAERAAWPVEGCTRPQCKVRHHRHRRRTAAPRAYRALSGRDEVGQHSAVVSAAHRARAPSADTPVSLGTTYETFRVSSSCSPSRGSRSSSQWAHFPFHPINFPAVQFQNPSPVQSATRKGGEREGVR